MAVLMTARPWRHPKTGMFWFRRAVPLSLRPIVGKVEERRTLGTKDPRTAALRHPQVAAKVAEEWLRLQGHTPTVADLPPRYSRFASSPDARELVYQEAMAAAGFTDEREADAAEWTPPAAIARAIDPQAFTPKLTLKDLLEGWWTEAKATGRKPSTYESYRHTVEGLQAHLGHDDAGKVTPEDVVSFKDHRLGLGVSPKTVKDSDLAGLKTVFGWAVSNRKLPKNPATGITIKLGKPVKLRAKGLTEAETKALLNAALGVTGKGRTDQARRWVPILAIYTGARVGELAQLRRQDVRREAGVWTIHLTPEAGTIKTNEARTIVLHPHAVELGFPAWAAAQPEGHGHLFLNLPPNSPSGAVLGPLQGLKNRLAEFARTVITDPNVAPLHGLRHRFKTVGMEAGVPQRVLDAIQGHAAKSASDGYGEVTVKAMARWIEQMPRVR